MKTAISLPDDVAARVDASARRHGMTRSEFYRRAAERYVDELARRDVTERVNRAVAAAGQPSDDTELFRGNARTVVTQDDW